MQRVERSIRVRLPVEEVYQLWREFASFPQFMEHVEEVRPTGAGERFSHWRLRPVLGVTLEWDAEMVEDQPNRAIGWRSTDGNLGNSGTVTFAPLEDETEVHVIMQWYE